jgi:HNH endonuclease
MNPSADMDGIVASALKEGVIFTNSGTGEVFGKRWRAGKARGCKNTKGYVVFTLHFNGRRYQLKAHRVIWIAANGEIPDGLVIDHVNGIKCDNRLDNLRLATPKVNARNRRTYKGDQNPAAVINIGDVKSMRALYPSIRSYKKLAERFGVSRSLVAQIIRRELWV